MKREPKPTKRQEWTQRSAEIQERVNATLEEFRADIETANLLMEQYHESDEEKAREVAASIIEYLDERWSWFGDLFFVSGQWHEPLIAMNEDGLIAKHEKTDAGEMAHSNGFVIKMMETEDGRQLPRVGLSFMVAKNLHLSTASVQGKFELLAFAEPEEVSLQYMRPGDKSVVSSDLVEVDAALHRADLLLDLYLNNSNSGFYNANPRKQEALLQSIVDSFNDVLPSPESLDTLMIEDSTTNVFYIQNWKGHKLVRLSTNNDERFTVTGRVEGVTLMDMVRNEIGNKFNSPGDVSAAASGLMMVVSPTDVSYDIEDYAGQSLLIPVRSFEEMKLQLF